MGEISPDARGGGGEQEGEDEGGGINLTQEERVSSPACAEGWPARRAWR